MALFNTTGLIYQMIAGTTSNVTGADYLSILLIIFMLVLIGVIMHLNIELIMIFLTPLILVLMAYDKVYMALGMVFLIALGIIFARNMLFQRF